MIIWWQGLNRREQNLVSFGIIVVISALYFVLLHEPFEARKRLLSERLVAETNILRDISRDAQQASAIRAQLAASETQNAETTKSLLAIINESARAAGIHQEIKRVVPAGSSSATVVFEQVKFDLLAAWLINLNETQSAVVHRINVDKGPQEGLVRANLTLVR